MLRAKRQLECCLGEWRTGRHILIQFTEELYGSVYANLLQDLRNVHADTFFGERLLERRIEWAAIGK